MKNENKTISETIKELRAKLDSDNAREIACNTSYKVICGVVKAWEGLSLLGKRNEKKFVADVVAAFAAQGGTITARLEFTAGLCYVNVAGLSNDGDIRHFLGYTNSADFRSVHALSVAGFEQNDGSNGIAAAARIASRKAITSDQIRVLAEAIHAENQAKAKLDALVAFGAPLAQLDTVAKYLACRDCQ